MSIQTTVKGGVSWLAERRLLGIVLLAASVVLAATIIALGPEADPQIKAEKAWPVSVAVAAPGEIAPTLVSFGRVESRQVATLKTSVGAPVDSVLTPEGSWVEKGELMITLEKRELELALRRAESEYKRRVAVLTSVRNDYKSEQNMTAHHEELRNIADSKLQRHEELYKSRMISDAILDEVRQQASERAITLEQHLSRLANFPSLIEQHEAMVAEAKAVLETTSIELAQTEIRAPFAGRVIATMVAPGDRILPGVPIVRVADYSRLEVRAPIPPQVGDKLRERLAAGAPVTASGVLDGREIRFTLERLSGDVKAGQSGLDAFFKPQEGVSLDIGRVINLSVQLPVEQNVVALPIQSIYENDRVYKVVEDRLVGVRVEQVGDYLDPDGKFRVLIRSGDIAAGDHLVTTQLPRAITGLLVEPIGDEKFEEALAVDANK